jgi:ketopantoate reductase
MRCVPSAFFFFVVERTGCKLAATSRYLRKVRMAIQKAAIIGRGALGLLYGDLIARGLGSDAVEYVMDDARFERHQGEALTINGAPCRVKTIPSQDASPTDLVILATKATGLAGTLVVAEDLVGPRTRVVPLLNGTTSEERVAARFGWKNTVISVAQGMDATFIEGELTYAHPGEVRFGAASGTAQETVSDVADFYARVGERHDLRMPQNEFLSQRIHQIEKSYEDQLARFVARVSCATIQSIRDERSTCGHRAFHTPDGSLVTDHRVRGALSCVLSSRAPAV